VLFYFVALCTVIADQLSKQVMLQWLAGSPGQRVRIIPGLFDFYLQFNTGGAFSVFHDRPIVIIVVSLVAVASMIWYVHRDPSQSLLLHIVFGLIVGGAVGNLIDRFRLGAVIDFMHVYWRDWYWPTFNVADAAISIGVGLYILFTVRSEIKRCKGNRQKTNEVKREGSPLPPDEENPSA
jgi:signal peptidase II